MAGKKSNLHQVYRKVCKIKAKNRYSDFKKATNTIKQDMQEVFNPAPRCLQSLGANILFKPLTSQDELVWCCNLIHSFKNIIEVFLAEKLIYERHILSGDFFAAQDTLCSIEEKCGWSLWLIEARFFCFQKTMGLEGNKDFLSEVYNSKVDKGSFQWVYYLSYLISERNETGCDVDIFQYRQRSIISGISDTEFRFQVEVISSYVAFGELYLTEEKAVTLFRFFQKQSIIDLYELVLRMLVENEFDKHFSSCTLPLKIISPIIDHRLEKLKSIPDENTAYDKEKIKLLPDDVNVINPNITNILFKIGVPMKSNNDFIQSYIDAVTNVMEQKKGFDESSILLTSLCLNLKHIDSIYGLFEVPLRLLTQTKGRYFSALNITYGHLIPDDELDCYIEEYLGLNGIYHKNKVQKVEEDSTVLLNDNESEKLLRISNFTKYYFLKLKFLKLIENEDYKPAFNLFVSHFIANPNLTKCYDLREVFSGKGWPFYKGINSFIDSSIMLDAYLQLFNDEKQLFNAKACWRTFLKSCNANKPSELKISDFSGDRDRYFYFLHKVCSSFNLGQDSLTYKSPREITIERIAICDLLIETYGKLEYVLSEREGLERQLAISDGIQEVDIAGLTVDQDRFCKVAKNKYIKSFERYKSLMAIGEGTLDSRAVIAKIQEKSSLFKTPQEESYSILISLLYDLVDLFLKNHEFGLDYYLSMRVRHGRFMGVSRGALERHKLITKFSNEANEYSTNTHWNSHYEGALEGLDFKKLNDALANFSESIDNQLSKFIENYIQIQSDEKVEGIFKIDVTNLMVELLVDTIYTDTTMDEFLAKVLELFTINIEVCANTMKDILTKELQARINVELSDLQRITGEIIAQTRSNALLESIIAARTDMNHVFNDISTWFDISGENKKSIRTYSFENIVDIALSRTKRVHQLFNPSISFDTTKSNLHFHSDTLAIMVDALTILLSNISEHGKDSNAEVSVLVLSSRTFSAVTRFTVQVTNPVLKENVDFTQLEKIKSEILSNDVRSRQEGGSGFHKLVALPYIEKREDVSFGYEDGLFKVTIMFSLSSIA